MFKVTFKKFLLIALIALLACAALPAADAYAAALEDDPQPTDAKDYPHLKLAFQHLKLRVKSQGILLEECDLWAEEAQNLIDFAAQKGLDASAVQAALDDLLAVLPDAKASHTEAAALAEAHSGFDASGNVTDPKTARETIQALRTALRTTIETLDGTPRALLAAMRTFIKDNRGTLRPAETAQP
ncbi:MAG: hypothetical protein ACOYYS_00830 [Chloroflexota bacterium]